jgi:hypothetical protein
VEIDIDGVTQVRQVLAGGHSLSSGGPPEAHFGLGSARMVDEVRVVWPGGDVTREMDVSASQLLEVWR